MNTAENKRSVMVGAFVLLGIVIFAAGVFILGGKQKRFVSSIGLKARFDDVAGLRTGNNVWFSGVKIGTVNKITLQGGSGTGSGDVEIVMNIDESATQFIRKDAMAKISSESLIGNKNVVIYGGNPQSPQVQDGDLLRSEKLLSTEDMMATLQENNKNLLAITDNFKTLSENLTRGEGTVGALLTDTTLAENLRMVVSGLQQTSANTAKASRTLSQFTAKLNQEDGLANQLLTDTVVFNKLRGSVEQLQQTTAAAAQMTNNLRQTSSKLNNDNNALGVLLNDPGFAEELKKTMDNLESSTNKFDENMEALQHNFLFRGYFKKQAKRKAQQKAQAQEKESQ